MICVDKVKEWRDRSPQDPFSHVAVDGHLDGVFPGATRSPCLVVDEQPSPVPPLLLRPGRTVISRVDKVSMLEGWSPGDKELFFGIDKFTKNEK